MIIDTLKTLGNRNRLIHNFPLGYEKLIDFSLTDIRLIIRVKCLNIEFGL